MAYFEPRAVVWGMSDTPSLGRVWPPTEVRMVLWAAPAVPGMIWSRYIRERRWMVRRRCLIYPCGESERSGVVGQDAGKYFHHGAEQRGKGAP